MENNIALDTNRLAVMQIRSDWQRYVTLLCIMLAKVPLIRWQFIIRVLLLIYLSFALAHLFWLLLPEPVIPPAVVAIVDYKDIVDVDNKSLQIAQLKSLQVFGKTEQAPPQVVPAINAPSAETHLNLALLGIIVSNNEPMARAIIAAGSQQDIYAVGDSLPAGDGITLVKVMTDRVIINNKGQLESLYLYQLDQKAKAIAASMTPVISPEYAQKMREWQEAHVEPEVEAPPPKPVVYSADQAITAVGRSMPSAVAMSVYQEGGKMAGYKIQPGQDPEKFKLLGLTAGDLVIAINGWPMTNPAQIMEMYQEMSPGGSTSLQIKRGSNVLTVDIPPQ